MCSYSFSRTAEQLDSIGVFAFPIVLLLCYYDIIQLLYYYYRCYCWYYYWYHDYIITTAKYYTILAIYSVTFWVVCLAKHDRHLLVGALASSCCTKGHAVFQLIPALTGLYVCTCARPKSLDIDVDGPRQWLGQKLVFPHHNRTLFYKNGNLEPYLRQKNQQPGDAKECEVRYKAFWRWNMELETSSFVVKLHTHKTETLTLKPPAMCWTPYIYAHTHIVFSHCNIDPETSCYVLKLHTYMVFSHWNIDPETSHAMCWNSIHTQSLLTLKHGPWNFMLCTENAYLKHWAWSLQLYVSYKHEQTAGQTMYTPKLHPAAESLAHTDDASGGLPSEYGPKSQAAFKYPPGTCDKSKI